MKMRIIAVFLILFVAAWLPMVGQQPSTTPAVTDASKAEKPSCACCEHHDAKAQDGKAGQAAGDCCHGKDGKTMSCCEGKDAKDMDCCKKHANDKYAAENCCSGKDGKMCAAKKGDKGCCDDVNCKSCCQKSTTAANSADPGNCCPGKHSCCHGKAQA